MEKARLFIAIDFPEKVHKRILEIRDYLESRNLFEGKFVDPEHLHLTLKFLGDIEVDKIAGIQEQLRQIKMASIEAKLGNLDVIVKENSIKILYVNVVSKELMQLQKLIDQSLSNFFEFNKDFLSHLTIARVKYVSDRKFFLDTINKIIVGSFSFPITQFILKKSLLSSDGPEHTIIEKFELNL